MIVAAPGQLKLDESPSSGSRSVDCFEKLEQIGEGTYGQVYMARETRTGEIVALKKIRMYNEREGFPITAIREIKILKKLHHENVIQLKEIVTSPDGNKYKGSIYMVFEYMDHDLTGLSDHPGMELTIPQIKVYTTCQNRIFVYAADGNYTFINAGSNLLIDNEGNLKLADFGLARSFSSDHNGNLTNRVITIWYRPPELLLGTTKYGPAVDMWSVGCIFAELLLEKPIFPGKNEPSRPLKRRVLEAFKDFDPHALELLERMLTLDPSQQRQQEEIANCQKLQLPQPHAHLPPIQQPGQVHPQMRPGPNQPPVVAGPSHYYGKPHGTPGGLNRYPQVGDSIQITCLLHQDSGGHTQVVVVPEEEPVGVMELTVVERTMRRVFPMEVVQV
ncbi:Cyclin-dependent kinase C-2 [Acorus calamus]|uniref:[RNA-polymerase]-subunit kinase n=1 Tax=Acorus calamus TaxID=4465 RepID=A0AAV9DL15_ACOCL|nr:Cyclin-dependent kinase C-2 [Acorus calamus]